VSSSEFLTLGSPRATVRDAQRRPLDRRLIIRRHGSTFVAKHPICEDLSRNSGIAAMIQSGGHRPGFAGWLSVLRRAGPVAAGRATMLDRRWP
jgi:hypothetical protein